MEKKNYIYKWSESDSDIYFVCSSAAFSDSQLSINTFLVRGEYLINGDIKYICKRYHSIHPICE